MPTLTRDGVALYYEVHGAGPTLLLSHGFSATSAMWQGQIAALAATHQLVLWDMRGHGQSDYPADPAAYSAAAPAGHARGPERVDGDLLDGVGVGRGREPVVVGEDARGVGAVCDGGR